jgi:hypothetical protein
LLEQEDERFALGDAVDIVVGEGLIVAVEVVGLDDCLVLGGLLVADCLLQVLLSCSQRQQQQQDD